MSAISGLGSSSSYAGYGGVDPAKMKDKMFAAMDANGDGDVTKTELQSLLDKMSAASGSASTLSVDDIMNSVDTDGDGSLSKSEFAASGPKPKDTYGSDNLSSQMSTAQFAQMAGAGGPPPGPPPGGGISSLDTDDDGSISSAEFGIDSTSNDTQLADLFKAIDTDSSGSLSSEETAAFKTAMNAARPAGPPPQQAEQSAATLDALLQRYAQYAQATNDSSSTSQLSLVA